MFYDRSFQIQNGSIRPQSLFLPEQISEYVGKISNIYTFNAKICVFSIDIRHWQTGYYFCIKENSNLTAMGNELGFVGRAGGIILARKMLVFSGSI